MASKEISYGELKALIKEGKELVLVDVRSKDEVDRGRIPGSIHIPVDSVESEFSLDPAAFQDKFGVPKPPLDAPNLVFHCQIGRRGAAATQKAQKLGFIKDFITVHGTMQEPTRNGQKKRANDDPASSPHLPGVY